MALVPGLLKSSGVAKRTARQLAPYRFQCPKICRRPLCASVKKLGHKRSNTPNRTALCLDHTFGGHYAHRRCPMVVAFIPFPPAFVPKQRFHNILCKQK